MANKDRDLWGYVTGAVEAPIAATGGGIRAVVERWRSLRDNNDVDFGAEGLLDGADDREARLDLLDQLYAAGIPLEELRAAVEQDRLALLPVEGVLAAGDEHTVAEMAEESGLDQSLVARRLRALGLGHVDAETPLHDDALAAARALRELEESGMPSEGIDAICRTLGRSVNNVASAVRETAGAAYLESGDNERDLGLRYAAAARRLIPVMTPLLEFGLTMHLLRLVRSDVVSRAERAKGSLPNGRCIAVCFADLAGFTELGERLDADQVGDVVQRFEALVTAKTPPGARHVKTVGDAAMIIADDVDPVIEAAVELVRGKTDGARDLPAVHAGVALGWAVSREGDWHGSPVNVASRLAERAPAGHVFVTEEARGAANGDLDWRGSDDLRLKGIDEPVRVFRLLPG